MGEIYAATLVPLRGDLSCDSKRLAEHCKDLLKRGCTGIALFGTTGEGPSFSTAEKIKVLHQLIQEGIAPGKIILSNGSAGISDSIELAQAALETGCKAYLPCPPSFYKKVPDRGVVAFYREIIQKAPKLPILLYHIPQYSGVPITLEVIRQLREEFPEEVVGLKESEGNLSFAKQVIEMFPGFHVYSAKELDLIEAFRLGVKGSICGIANLYPELICSLSQRKENPKELERFVNALQGLPFIPAAKAVLEKRIGEKVRPPLAALKAEEKEAFLRRLL